MSGALRGARWQRSHGLASLAGALLLLVLLATLATPARAQGGDLPIADAFSPPLGFRDGLVYTPRIEYVDGVLIENTDYGILNPDLIGIKCFGQPWEKLYHAGEDLYRPDGASTAGAEVTAVAAGRVVYANPFMNYPGLVIMIEHLLPAGERVYSVYAHLSDESIEVVEGDIVQRGQRLGEVLYQRYAGRYPQYHPSGDDAHLHFEIRYFYDATRIYQGYAGCNGIVPGRGYTYPQHPDDFPAPGAGYTDPSTFVEARRITNTPALPPTATASLTSTPSATRPAAPSATRTRTATPRPGVTATPTATRPVRLRLPLLFVN